MKPLRLLLSLLFLACDSAPSGELPPSVLDASPPVGRLVKAADMVGYLVRPTDRAQAPAALLLVDAIDESSRSWAMERGRTGSFVLVIEPSTPTARARTYLDGISGIGEITLVCHRTECPAPESDGQPP